MFINIVSTWLYISPVNENIKYHQVKGKSSSKKFIETYLKNIVCFFWSARKFNKSNTKYILFVNTDIPRYINDFDIINFLNIYDIEIVKLENVFCISPPNYFKSWNSQFVIIDILKWYSNLNYEFNALILDNDCLIINDLDQIFEGVAKVKGILNYEINYDDEHDINGLNKKQLSDLFKIYHNIDHIDSIKYFGGEFVCFNSNIIKNFYNESIRLYMISLERFKSNQIKYNEEAHLLSSVYFKLGFTIADANKYIKRIWTNPVIYYNVTGKEFDLLIWHLPSEKGKGFNKLFLKIKNKQDDYIKISDLKYLFRLEIFTIYKIYYAFLKILRNIYLFISKA